jgi:hypothetical protein
MAGRKTKTTTCTIFALLNNNVLHPPQGGFLNTIKSTAMGIEEFLEQRFRNEGFKLGEQVGMEKGVYQEKLAITQKLLAFTDFSMEKIADMAGVSVAFVEEVKAALK